MRLSFFRRPQTPSFHAELYRQVVDQARMPGFFRSLGVPDTVDGRFDMIVLHVFLVLERLHGSGTEAEMLGQRLFDHMIFDMDVNLREMGIGDVGVGKRIKKMGEAYYGRSKAYRKGLQSDEDTSLIDALDRNVFRGCQSEAANVAALAGYLRRELDSLRAQPVQAFLAGEISFGPPPEAAVEPVQG